MKQKLKHFVNKQKKLCKQAKSFCKQAKKFCKQPNFSEQIEIICCQFPAQKSLKFPLKTQTMHSLLAQSISNAIKFFYARHLILSSTFVQFALFCTLNGSFIFHPEHQFHQRDG